MASTFENFIATLVGPEIRLRPMFGGSGLFYDNAIMGLIAYDEFYLKTGKETTPLFDAHDCTWFIYEGKNKPITMPYRRVPDALLEDEEALQIWLQAAISVGLRAKNKPRS
ncbi:MAG: TfoX/Sxy family protein [Pseudomonadota bacterium]